MVYLILSLIYISEFINEMISITKDDMLNKILTSKEMEMGLEMMKKFMNPLILSLQCILYGLIYSLIVGAIVKNENPQSL
jgi:hypothetical protein